MGWSVQYSVVGGPVGWAGYYLLDDHTPPLLPSTPAIIDIVFLLHMMIHIHLVMTLNTKFFFMLDTILSLTLLSLSYSPLPLILLLCSPSLSLCTLSTLLPITSLFSIPSIATFPFSEH